MYFARELHPRGQCWVIVGKPNCSVRVFCEKVNPSTFLTLLGVSGTL